MSSVITFAQYTDDACDSADPDTLTSSWTVTGSTTTGTEQCQTMLERIYKIWHLSTYTCGADTITSVNDWCSTVNCQDCDAANNNYQALVNYTWNTEAYFVMRGGGCAEASRDAWVCEDDADYMCTTTPMVLTTTTVWFRMTDSNQLGTLYPCSELSSAPTSAPTDAPTSENDELFGNTIMATVLLTAIGMLLLMAALLLVYWRHRWLKLNKIEPWKEEMQQAATSKCAGDKVWGVQRLESEGLGVSTAYIIGDFFMEAQQAAAIARERELLEGPSPTKHRRFIDPTNPVFHNISSVMCRSETAKGFGMKCPRDRKPNCAVVDALHRSGQAGAATQFLSWVWSYRTRMFTRTIRAWLEQGNLVPKETFIWVCFFCNNQFRLKKSNANDLDEVFETRLRSAGSMIAMLDTWESPMYLTRCWTIFEQYIGAKLGIDITVIVPPEVMDTFTKELENGNIKHIKESLTNLNVADAKASVPEDELKVKQLIASTVGFDAVNESVANSMHAWCATVLKAYLEGSTWGVNNVAAHHQNHLPKHKFKTVLRCVHHLQLRNAVCTSVDGPVVVADEANDSSTLVVVPEDGERIVVPPLSLLYLTELDRHTPQRQDVSSPHDSPQKLAPLHPRPPPLHPCTPP